MRLIKLAIISFVAIFLVVFLLSLLIPSHVRVSRAINIDAPVDSVMPQLADIRNWKSWNAMLDNPDYKDVKYTENSFYSDQVQIVQTGVKADSVLTTWHQLSGRDIHSGMACFNFNGVTAVQWYFDFKLRWYPWEKIGSIIFDKQLGPPMEKSLDNLKKKVERQP
jgi:hypothetical protein